MKILPVKVNENLHPTTIETVLVGVETLLEKLYKSQEKYGLDNGWKVPPSHVKVNDGRYFVDSQGCVEALKKHLQKGDTIDSIAYLLFLNELEGGEKIEILKQMFNQEGSTK